LPKSRLKHRNKQHLYAITPSARAKIREGASGQFLGCLFEEPNHQQENYGPDDSIDDFRNYAADENKPDSRQEPAGNEGADNADHNVADEPEAVALHN
jgi:hypothetical protein